jgi:2-polyprenyl-6-hydroxyphenyl methylase/3-demethylubiquinone-9 3-methyltransferase
MAKIWRKAIEKRGVKSIADWWKKYLKICPPLISDWVQKETLWLQKNIKRGSIVLDVGCGWGRDLKAIAKIVKKGIGIDNDPKIIKEAKKNLAKFKNIEVFLEDAKKMHFDNNIFDYVFCLGNTFGNFGKDKYKILREMKRVAKNNGKIILSVYSEKALPERIKGYKKVGWQIKKITKDGTVYTKDGIISEQFSKRKIKEIFKKVGLNVKIIELNPISYICEATKR